MTTPAEARAFGPRTTEGEIAAFVDAAVPSERWRTALAELLPEETPLYAGRGTNQTKRIRGYVLAAFERVGLPGAALPYVLEELESGTEAYLVAAAARALRGFDGRAAQAAPFLVNAIDNIRYHDEILSFEAYLPPSPPASPTTAVGEILAALAWLGPDAAPVLPRLEALQEGAARLPNSVQPALATALRAIRTCAREEPVDCCGPVAPRRQVAVTHAIGRARLEDQDGERLRWDEYFTGKPSVVAFFYTRCSNPNKCSLTISRLVGLRKELDARGFAGRVRMAAVTYDPQYDLPSRLRTFGLNRGVAFGDDFRFFRAPEDHDEIRAGLGLGVNYAGSIVNRHRIELFLLDAEGRVAAEYTRLQWDPAAVADEAERLLAPAPAPSAWPLSTSRRAAGALPALGIALLPKCPMCWAAYLTAAGAGGLQGVLDRTTVIPVLLMLLGLHLALLFRRARRTRRSEAVLLSAAGAAGVIAGGLLWELPMISYAGVALLVGGALLGSLPPRTPLLAAAR